MILMGHRTFCSCFSTLCSRAVHNSAPAGLGSSNIRVSEKNKEGACVVSNNLFIEWVELEKSFKITQF